MKHGGGEERIDLCYNYRDIPSMADPMDSDTRYLFMHLLYSVHSEAKRTAAEETAKTYRRAFADGRLKKRKERGQNAVKVWIDP